MTLTPREAAVAELWDAGCGSREIARRLGLTSAQVADTMFIVSDDGGRETFAIRTGTRRLAAAIARHHPDRCPLLVQPVLAKGEPA